MIKLLEHLISLGFAFVLLAWGGLALVQGHYYGDIGVAINWIVVGLGLAILMIKFRIFTLFRPPWVYGYVGFFAFMFIRTMGWITI